MAKSSWIALVLICTSAAYSQTVPASKLPQLDTYLSNFAEAEFSASALELQKNFDFQLLKFTAAHAVWNNKGTEIEMEDQDSMRGLSLSEIGTISKRYFGRTSSTLAKSLTAFPPDPEVDPVVARQKAAQGVMVITGLEPQQTPNFSRAFRVRTLGQGRLEVDAVDYENRTGQNRPTQRDYSPWRFMTYILGPNPFDSKRWSMLGSRKISRKDMELRLKVKSFSIPRWKVPS